MPESASMLLVVVLAVVVLALAGWVLVSQTRLKKRVDEIVENIENYSSGIPLPAPTVENDSMAKVEKALYHLTAGMKESAQRDREAIDYGMDVVCSIDKNGTFTFANPASAELFGYVPAQLVGKSVSEMIVTDDGANAKDAIRQFLGGTSISSFENRIRTKSGALLDIKWSARWSEKEKALYWIARDVTAKKQAERLKREFVAMISHDLRTPLMSVEASLALLSNGVYGELSDKAQHTVVDAERNISYIINLITGLLDIEKMESGKLQLTIRPMDIYSVLHKSTEMVRPLAQEKQININVEKQKELEINADESRLVQVVVNLVSNAVKFSPSNTKIDVRVKAGVEEIEVQVADEGPGISNEDQKVIFERFAQGRSADDQVGSGLGLAICKAIVDEHGGAIGVHSELGKGSTFWFRLPMQAQSRA